MEDKQTAYRLLDWPGCNDVDELVLFGRTETKQRSQIDPTHKQTTNKSHHLKTYETRASRV